MKCATDAEDAPWTTVAEGRRLTMKTLRRRRRVKSEEYTPCFSTYGIYSKFENFK
jgi:hypothetical protein